MINISSPVLGQKIFVPPTILLQFNFNNAGTVYYNTNLPNSKLAKNSALTAMLSDTNTSSVDFEIYGGIYSNCKKGYCDNGQRVYFEIVNPNVVLESPTNSVNVAFTGYLNDVLIDPGRNAADLIYQRIKSNSLQFQADIKIYGDIDESTVEYTDRTGTYEGTLTLRVTIL